MPRGKKSTLKINKDTESTPEIKEQPPVEAEVVKTELVEVEIGVDITKDGKTPLVLVFECETETRVQAEWEYTDRTKGELGIDVYPAKADTLGRELKKSETKGRAFSGAYCIPAKRIIKCNAKKVYAIY